ncbi:ArsC family reductase [Kaarinaea lacus]
MTTLYGISNCDTVKKARKWLDAAGIDYEFHDLRKQGLTQPLLRGWVNSLGWQPLINKRGTTWRKLGDQAKNLETDEQAIALMLDQPTVIKRPVLVHNQSIKVGFNEEEYKALFA